MRSDWIYATLGQVCDVVGGGTPSKRNPAFYEGDIPWATVRDMRNEVLSRTEFCISDDALRNSPTKVIPKRNVVIATRVGLGKVCLLEQDTAINQDLRGIIPKSSDLDIRYLFRWFQSISDFIKSYGTGATVKGVKLPFIKSLSLPLPPLPEQKRIVTILDEAFAGIDAAIANTEKNLANARELFDGYLSRALGDLADCSKSQRLGDTCLVERGSSPRPIKKYLTSGKSGVNWIKIGDTKGDKKYISSTREKITVEGALKSRRVDPGDFLLTNSMSYGRPYIMATAGYIHDGWFVLRLKEHIDTEFFYYLLSSSLVQAQFESLAAGAIVKNISSELVKRAVLPVPSIEKQREMVELFDSLSRETARLEAIQHRKIESLEELKQSLLQKALSGKLTANVVEKEFDEAVA